MKIKNKTILFTIVLFLVKTNTVLAGQNTVYLDPGASVLLEANTRTEVNCKQDKYPDVFCEIIYDSYGYSVKIGKEIMPDSFFLAGRAIHLLKSFVNEGLCRFRYPENVKNKD